LPPVAGIFPPSLILFPILGGVKTIRERDGESARHLDPVPL
jgi:hypothetical protein